MSEAISGHALLLAALNNQVPPALVDTWRQKTKTNPLQDAYQLNSRWLNDGKFVSAYLLALISAVGCMAIVVLWNQGFLSGWWAWIPGFMTLAFFGWTAEIGERSRQINTSIERADDFYQKFTELRLALIHQTPGKFGFLGQSRLRQLARDVLVARAVDVLEADEEHRASTSLPGTISSVVQETSSVFGSRHKLFLEFNLVEEDMSPYFEQARNVLREKAKQAAA